MTNLTLKNTKFEGNINLNEAHAPEDNLVEKDDVLVSQMQQLGTRRCSVEQNVQKIRRAMDLFYTKCRDINNTLPTTELDSTRILESIERTFRPMVAKMDQQLVVEETSEREEGALVEYLSKKNLRIDLPEEEEENEGVTNTVSNEQQSTNKAMSADDDVELVESNYHSR